MRFQNNFLITLHSSDILKRLQRLSETVRANNRIPQAVRQGIPDRRTSHTESLSAIGAELVARYDQELSGGGSEMLP